jgi:hypothetical protein
MTTDSRQLARTRIHELVTLLRSQAQPAQHDALIAECEALSRAIEAFHMEGIRFRIFNVDRLLTRSGAALPEHARGILEEARRELEAAGFHTRSHQAPT